MIDNAYCLMLNWQPYPGCKRYRCKLVQFRYKMNTLINKPPSVVVIRFEIN